MKRCFPVLALALGLVACRTSASAIAERRVAEGPLVAEAAPERGGESAAAGEPASEGSATAPDRPAAADEPTVADEPAPADEPAAAEAPAEPATPIRGSIKPFFARDDDEALDDRRYTVRAIPSRPAEIRGLLRVKAVLGLPLRESPDPAAPVVATLMPKGLETATDRCIWVSFQPDIAWTKGQLRCGDVFLRERDDGGYGLPVFETTEVDGARWHRILATNDGRSGWLRTDAPVQPFSEVLSQYSAGGSPTWDRQLYAEPGQSPRKLGFRGWTSFRIRETREVDGRIWLRVAVRVDQCLEDSNRKLGEGWVPLHATDGSLNAYYELSC